jgi:hypothetical protein
MGLRPYYMKPFFIYKRYEMRYDTLPPQPGRKWRPTKTWHRVFRIIHSFLPPEDTDELLYVFRPKVSARSFSPWDPCTLRKLSIYAPPLHL